MIGKCDRRPSTIRMARVLAIIFLFLPWAITIQAQSKAEIQNVDFQLRNDSLFVTYDLVKAKVTDRFLISISIKSSSGNTLQPMALTGDIGENVVPGKSKKIIWDINRDNIFINEDISVVVAAKPIIPSQVSATGKKVKFVPRGIAVLLSAVVPGLGISKLDNGGPYWVMAIAFYGCAAGSFYYSYQSGKSYSTYKESTNPDERDNLYTKVRNQQKTAEILLYSAGAIWLGNMLWTLLQPNKTKPGEKKVSFNTYYDPFINRPIFCLKYKF